MQIPAPQSLLLAYLILVNTSTFLLFAHDKSQAKQKLWRIKETTLHSTALLGGWGGGFTAMHMLHHKNRKQSFLWTYVGCAGFNAGVGGFMLWKMGARGVIGGAVNGLRGMGTNKGIKANAIRANSEIKVKPMAWQRKKSDRKR